MKEEDYIIYFVCDECDRLTLKAKELMFYFSSSGIVEVRCFCMKCYKQLKKIQNSIKE